MSLGLDAQVRPLEPRDALDLAALGAWLATSVACWRGPFELAPFKGGQSNPTYRLRSASGDYVLRRKPFGALLASAHAVEREYRVISALGAAGFAVPRTYALCEDAAVIGSAFYVMESVDGPIYWNGALPELAPERRRQVYLSMIDTLAALHNLDPVAAGLGDYGRPGNYFGRQVERWTRQYRASETQPIPAADRLIDWLPRTLPVQMRSAVVHGDFRLDNIVFAPAGEVRAVLDWELSTLGDPLADFSYLLMNWVLPADGRSALGGLDLAALGIPSAQEAVALYCRLTGREGLPELDWYFAYNLFRLTGIVQGIAGRVRDGTAASAQAASMAARAPMLANAAWDFALRAGAVGIG